MTRCDRCNDLFDEDYCQPICEPCDEKYRAESLAAVGGEALMRQIAGLERETREYEREAQ